MPLKPWACARAGSFIPLYTLRIKNNNRYYICQDACRVALHKAHHNRSWSLLPQILLLQLSGCVCAGHLPLLGSIKVLRLLWICTVWFRGSGVNWLTLPWHLDLGTVVLQALLPKLEILCLQAIGYKWMAAYACQMPKGDEGSYRYRCGEQGQRSGFIYADACFSCVFGAPVLV